MTERKREREGDGEKHKEREPSMLHNSIHKIFSSKLYFLSLRLKCSLKMPLYVKTTVVVKHLRLKDVPKTKKEGFVLSVQISVYVKTTFE